VKQFWLESNRPRRTWTRHDQSNDDRDEGQHQQ
jgi:hypothetical protein